VLAVGGLVLDQRARTAQLNGVPIDLARREFDLLWALARRSGAVATRRELLAEVWQNAGPNGHTLSVHLSRIREKLGETAATPKLVHIVRGVGLRLADQRRAITPGSEQEGTPPLQPPLVASVCLVDDKHQSGRRRVARGSSGAVLGAA
jgi:DNA-binding winged helix-turn-helix (wHTH) protein